MANEILWNTIKTDAGRELVVTEMLGIQTDPYYIENHPALLDVADVTGSGSDTANIREDNLNGAAAMTALANESDTYVNSTYDVNKYPVAVADYYTQWTVKDVAKMASMGGELDTSRFAIDMAQRRALTWTSLIATTQASITAVHTMTAAPTCDDLVVAGQKLELAYNDPMTVKLAILEPHQFHAIQLDAGFVQALNVAMQDPEIKALAKMLGGVYKGRYQGIDIFVSFKVGTNAGKYQGAVFCRGAILKSKGRPVAELADQVLLGDMLFDRQRSQTLPEMIYRGKTFMGCAIGQQAAGIRFASPT